MSGVGGGEVILTLPCGNFEFDGALWCIILPFQHLLANPGQHERFSALPKHFFFKTFNSVILLLAAAETLTQFLQMSMQRGLHDLAR